MTDREKLDHIYSAMLIADELIRFLLQAKNIPEVITKSLIKSILVECQTALEYSE